MIEDHPLRAALVEELHARPFPLISVPSEVVYLALKEPRDAANRDRGRDIAHLAELCAPWGVMPPAEATHFAATLGAHELTWESHTEFVTCFSRRAGLAAEPFDPVEAAIFPEDWIARAPGRRLAAVQMRIEHLPGDPHRVPALVEDWFDSETLVCGWVMDQAALIATDFRIDPNGQMRFAVFVAPGTGPARVGRLVQRLCEMETYRALSMLGLGRARGLTKRLNALDPELSALVAELGSDDAPAEETLPRLLAISGGLEGLAVSYSFRFGATQAYAALVHERLEALRETRFEARQRVTEFMQRRYEPAMRTVLSAEARLTAMVERSSRAAELLRTRVEVTRAEQNQHVLESMNRRAALQLRLQNTVEGLSVVAISYYAVSLAGYLASPLAAKLGLGKELAVGLLTPAVVAGVWLMVRRIRRRAEAA
ncbi:DUF3422 family protein [Paenirhodobacter enshiensis]|uniref:DUF3422 family protein n=1 Tax=Paenirhodobacter enshiensis TaxID=1105367 RepID=UPI003FA25479